MRKPPRLHICLAAALHLIIFYAHAQSGASRQKRPSGHSSGNQLSTPQYDVSLYKGLTWRCIGPFRGGRSLSVCGIPGDPLTYYAGAMGGGIWKTSDAGHTWHAMSDSV